MSKKLIQIPSEILTDIQQRLQQAGIRYPPMLGAGIPEAVWQEAETEAAEEGISIAEFWYRCVEDAYKNNPDRRGFNPRHWAKPTPQHKHRERT